MEFTKTFEDTKLLAFFLPFILEMQESSCDITLILLYICALFLICGLINWAYSSGGPAWKNGRNRMGQVPIPGPRGLPIFGSLFNLSHGLAHRTLARMASSHGAVELMAFSLGSTPAVVTSDPCIAREILTSQHFANRPIKESAKQLMFSRAIGFAPNGAHWRMLRKIASAHLFAPRCILAHEGARQLEYSVMLSAIAEEQFLKGHVQLRKHLQNAALNVIMEIVFGKRYNTSKQADELNELVREGFELLGAFNWSDHLPLLNYFYDPFRIQERCKILVPRVKKLVNKIIDEHRITREKFKSGDEKYDFVDVLLSLDDGEETLDEDDMVAVLWEMIFRGTDTTALVTEWIMAELILQPHIQANLHSDLQATLPTNGVFTDAVISTSPYLGAVVKEALRVHPPGPLLSWARLSTADVRLKNGMVVPANTTAMVNMWAITHDPTIWNDPFIFKPERFLPAAGGVDVDVRGGDLRVAPFGAGRRVCPGRGLGMTSVSLCVARLVMEFEWVEMVGEMRVDLSEELKLSCEMKKPLSAVAIPRGV